MKKKIYYLFIMTLFVFFNKTLKSQNIKEISGVILQLKDSITPVAYSQIINLRTNKFVLANEEGFFYLLANNFDTIVFKAIGFKKVFHVVNEKNEKGSFNVIFMPLDTVSLEGVDIYPISREELRRAFISLNVEEVKLAKPITNEELKGIGRNIDLNFGIKVRGPISTLYKLFGGDGKRSKARSEAPKSNLPVFKPKE